MKFKNFQKIKRHFSKTLPKNPNEKKTNFIVFSKYLKNKKTFQSKFSKNTENIFIKTNKTFKKY